MAVTIKDIARHLNLSEATISLAFNNSKLVNVKTKQRVLDAAKELGYTPNLIAKSLATKKSNSIGIIIPDMNIVFYANILKSIDKIVNACGYSLVMAMSNNDPKIEADIIRSFISKRIEGVLVVPTNQPTEYLQAYQKALEEYHIPIVYITSLYTVDNIKYVMGDIEEGTNQLVHHLFRLGHREIVFIGGDRKVPTTSLRQQGFMRALKECGLPIKQENFIECEDIHFEDAVEAAKNLLATRDDFTAICAMNDEMAIGVINVLNAAGRRVPEDISVVGYDNTIFSQVAVTKITTMDSDIDYTCEQAVEMLLKTITAQPIKQAHIKTLPTLIKRQSSGQARQSISS